MKNILLILLTTIFVMSCDETKRVIDTAGNVQLSGNYNVTEINGNTITEKAPNIRFYALDKTIRGNTGCNSFFGSYALDLYALSFSDIGSTEMACDQPIMDVENAFLNALNNTGSYDIQNRVLTLYSKNDRTVLLKANKEVTED
ncbi:META domain-containing protein [Aureisphaera sp. CAU 1614]|uniref:META domain-containing protein n=1 Tax=Halomarinibacterium sedimenti TaxID=2857106 RepID=A0A9X1JUQ5_9FLAO|nr:META domain-containing protein [Halomarinibacterium sedimenti]MBW2937099.1 META domain-containing protein [Halomarinibacterium sedimenti]